MKSRTRSALRLLATGLGIAAGSYVARAAATWFRYGHGQRPPRAGEADPLLDRFMPDYDVAERHHIRVDAPADVAFAAAVAMDLQRSAIIRGIFKTREMMMGAQRGEAALPSALVEQMQALGWRVLAEVPGREIVMGAATQPWEPNPKFHGLAPEEFLAFNEPNFVKIAWTLRVEPAGDGECIVRTETRVITTDARARASFGRYWSLVSPGAVLIRRILLRRLKKDAERRTHAQAVGSHSS
jgi:hypothetical protein